MTIRKAEPNDAKDCASIYSYYVNHTAFSFEYMAPDETEFRKRMEEISRFYPFLIYVREGETLGFAFAHAYHERQAYGWLAETSIYVKNGNERRGIGTALYGELLPILKRQGFSRALAIVAGPNGNSVSFHRKMGFELAAVLPGMGYKLGGWHEVTFMFCELNEMTVPMRAPVSFREIGWTPEK